MFSTKEGITKKKSMLKRYWPYGVTAIVALVVGGSIGAAGSGGGDEVAGPAPTVTVTSEPIEAVVDDGQLQACQRAVEELRQISLTANDDVALKYNDVVMILNGQLTAAINAGSIYVLEVGEIERGTELLREISTTAGGLADRVTAISPDYNECVG